MREILFKAKRLDNGEWVEGYYIGPIGVLDVHEICDVHDITGPRVEVDPSTVCEYTGLTDKKGVKIFEGDICLCPYIDPIFLAPWSEENNEKCKVLFERGAFIVEYEEKANILLSALSEKIEVIGNIHDREREQSD